MTCETDNLAMTDSLACIASSVGLANADTVKIIYRFYQGTCSSINNVWRATLGLPLN